MTQLTVAQRFAKRFAQERRLKAARDACDISNADIAEAVGTSDANVSKWLAGKTMPGDAALVALAGYFGVTPGWLHYGHEPREAPEADGRPEAYFGETPGTLSKKAAAAKKTERKRRA